MQKSFYDLEISRQEKADVARPLPAQDRKCDAVGQATKVIEPFYPKIEGAGRRPIGFTRMLSIYAAQQGFGLADEGIEDAIYDS